MLKNLIGLLVCMTITGALTMTNAQRPPGGGFGFGFGRPGGGGPGGGPGGGGPGGGGPGGPDRSETKIVDQFDSDQNGWLNAKERSAARVFAAKSMGEKRGGGFGFGGPRGRGGPPGGGGPFGRGPSAEATPGRQIMKTSVDFFPDAGLYDVDIVRTVFIDFENDDWEKELEDFRRTDVDVPATLTVDGEVYEGVGIHFRGASSYDHVPSGFMRSLNVSMDTVNSDQRLYGYKTLNLLNANGDDSLLSTVLYSHIANQYLPAPKANLMKVVINGEYWGVYTNVQQFDKIFLTEHFGASKGTRWKVPGSPNADGGLRYLGEELQPYQTRFEMKSNDGKKAWQRLINLCRVLNETPTDNLVAELEPILDIDSTLAFLALDVALVNQDGYWTRASDYALFLDAGGQFHIVPHDMNEAFRSRGGGGPGGPGGPGRGGPGGRGPGGDRGRGGFGGGFSGMFGFGGPPNDRGPGSGPPDDRGPGSGPPRRGPGGAHGGIDLDPLVGLDDDRFPLRGKLLAVPELKQRYMELVQQIANNSMNWSEVGTLVQSTRDMIDSDVAEETRRMGSISQFRQATADDGSLNQFLTARRDYLLNVSQW